MSDYGGCDSGEYEDYAWFYVEEEYIVADDLAEHQVPSPPPSDYVDDDMREDWDRYEYFNDLDYASDCYDEGIFQPHDAKDSKVGQKRKRAAKSCRSKKKPKTSESPNPIRSAVRAHSPVVWRSQRDRVPKPTVVTHPTETFALFGDWRERFGDTSPWDRLSRPAESQADVSGGAPEVVLFPTAESLDKDELAEDEDVEEGEDMEIDQDALMAALQRQLAAAGGPLSGMDPEQLLQFALRMATDKDAGDDIAGEMADAMLGGEEEEEDDEAKEAQLLSWVAQQRNANKDTAAAEPESPEATRDSNRPPTPPASQVNCSVEAADTKTESGGAKSKTWTTQETKLVEPTKRKAEDEAEDEANGSSKTTRKRVTRSFNAPTAASQAKAAATRNTRNTRSKK